MPGTFPRHQLKRKPLVTDPDMRHARAVMHVGIANPRWRGQRSRNSRRMCNPQFYVSGKRPIESVKRWGETTVQALCCQTRIEQNYEAKSISFQMTLKHACWLFRLLYRICILANEHICWASNLINVGTIFRTRLHPSTTKVPVSYLYGTKICCQQAQ